jgi:hypothetical protein
VLFEDKIEIIFIIVPACSILLILIFIFFVYACVVAFLGWILAYIMVFFLDLMNNFIVSFFTTLPHPAVMVLVPMSAIGLAISWIIPLL